MEFSLRYIVLLKMVYFTLEAAETEFKHVRMRRDTEDTIQITELNIVSRVVMRLADVHIKSVILNNADEAQEVLFEVRTPKKAFIHSFWLTSNNVTTRAVVKEKHEASDIYNSAVEAELSAGKLSQRTLITDDVDVDVFTVRVNVAANSFVEFHLQYQELLERFTGKYRQIIYVGAQGIIPKLSVTSEVREKEDFRDISYETPYGDNSNTTIAEFQSLDGFYARKMVWMPEVEEQTQVDFGGVVKPFIIEYILEPVTPGGFVFYTLEGDFAHLFSAPCEETKIMFKQMVFVIDISGSMKGTSIAQVAFAMNKILGQMRTGDFFNIVLFSKTTMTWFTDFLPANSMNIEKAKEYLNENLVAHSSTNINEAMMRALRMFGDEPVYDLDEQIARSIVFLTDGEATEGVTNNGIIRQNIRAVNYFEGEKCCRAAIFTVAFGKTADRDFLRVVANENGGSATVIKENEGDEAYFQLLESFESIKNPILTNVKFSFISNDEPVPVENVTQSAFVQYDCGSEIVVGGRAKAGIPVISEVEANTMFSKVKFVNIPSYKTSVVNAIFLSKLVKYTMVKDILKRAEMATDEIKQSKLENDALQMALEYGFVTRLTSLVVVDYTHRPRPVMDEIKNKALFKYPSTSTLKTENYTTDYSKNNIWDEDFVESLRSNQSSGITIVASSIVTVMSLIACLSADG